MAPSKRVDVNGKLIPSSTLRGQERMAKMTPEARKEFRVKKRRLEHERKAETQRKNAEAGIMPVLRTIEWPRATPTPLHPAATVLEQETIPVLAGASAPVTRTQTAPPSPFSTCALLESDTLSTPAEVSRPIDTTQADVPSLIPNPSLKSEILGTFAEVSRPAALTQAALPSPVLSSSARNEVSHTVATTPAVSSSTLSPISLDKDALGITAGTPLPVKLIEQLLTLQGEIDDWIHGCRLPSELLHNSSCLDHWLIETEHSIRTKLATGSLARFREIKIWQNRSQSAYILSRGIRVRCESLIQTWTPHVSQGIVLDMRLNHINFLRLNTILDAQHRLIDTAVRLWLLTPSAGITSILIDRTGEIEADWKFGKLVCNDIKLLKPKAWLNDVLLEHFISHPPPPPSVLCLSPLFYTKFLQDPPEAQIWDQAWKWQGQQASSTPSISVKYILNTLANFARFLTQSSHSKPFSFPSIFPDNIGF
ncbi:hypothetical protein FPV67DRAFT_1671677 [Lyophyllum atratum]|nr:hypothetical protein FPV67DRAFT_1671677 [Lyophyllum atratum]